MGVSLSKRAVFLDRDGVLNQAIIKAGKPYPPQSLAELIIIEDAFAALTKLKATGFSLIVVTNQPDVARGKTSKDIVTAIHQAMMEKLPLDEIRVCYHDDADQCQCRKPLPGLLLEAAKAHGIELSKSFMIGDRWRDVEAGQRAGCKTIWLNYDYSEQQPAKPADFVTETLTEAVSWITRN